MSNYGQSQPQLGATFYPGGSDDFYMPELVSPAPQRIMPEVPENMQENIAHLEHQVQSPDAYGHPGPPQIAIQNDHTTFQSTSYQNLSVEPLDQPNFSPFPALREVPPNVPPTDEQREATLEASREAVLASNDPETQLTWAQDALAYVEVAMQNEERISLIQPPRPRTPQVEHMLREDATKIVLFLADQHHPKAEYMKGTWLDYGKFGYRIDKKEAFRCYARALEKGYSRAYYRIGMQFEQSNEPLKAISYYQKGVDAGDSAACYRSGMMALLGQHSQPQNFERGLNLIYASAQTADENAPQGAYVFGMLQARELAQISIPERFLPLDIKGAKSNIEKAAFLGMAKAQVKMGAAYELCELGCEFNPTLSLHYNALAARQGEADAEMAISKWFLCGYDGLFEKNEEMAFTYARRAAQSGLPTAQFALGYFYEVGINVPMNLKEAREWYTKAAANGNKDAAGRIDSISRSKTISRKDHEKIALSKIRQQHGSHGQSPTEVPPIPAMPPPIDMPDPSRLSLNPNNYSSPYLAPRPPSVAPYPVNNDEFGRPGMPTHPTAEHRPASAFGINPNLRPSSAAASPSPRPDSFRPPAFQTTIRPYSSVEPNNPGYGQPVRASHSPGLQGRPQPRPVGAQPAGAPGPVAPPKVPIKVDIGFTAPPDPSGADRRQRLQKPNPQGLGNPQNVPPKATGDQFPVRKSSHQPPAPKPPSPSPAQRPQQNKPASSPAPMPFVNKPVSTNASSKPSPPPGKTATGKTATSSSSNRPPGKGPKTFEEMGVPQGKTDSDCTIM